MHIIKKLKKLITLKKKLFLSTIILNIIKNFAMLVLVKQSINLKTPMF